MDCLTVTGNDQGSSYNGGIVSRGKSIVTGWQERTSVVFVYIYDSGEKLDMKILASLGLVYEM